MARHEVFSCREQEVCVFFRVVFPPCAVWVGRGYLWGRRLHLEAREPRSHRVQEVGQEVDGAGHAWRREEENARETQERSSVNGIFTAVDLHYNSFNLLKLKLLKQEVSECDFQNKLSSGGVYFVCSRL